MKRNSILLFIVLFTSANLLLGQVDEKEISKKGLFLSSPELIRSENFAFDDSTMIQLFYENFESGKVSWSLTEGFEIGIPSSLPKSGSASFQCAAAGLNGNYENNANGWMISPTFILPDAADHLYLRYEEWLKLESDYDFGKVKISTDEGSSWIELYSSTGTTDWREMILDLSAYKGKSINIGFNLSSDSTIVAAGWFIDNVSVYYTIKGPLDASLQSFSSQNFPLIYMNVNVQSFGADLTTLNQSNFSVYENNVLQSNLFEVTPPNAGGGQRVADIVFLMDNSGSMGDEQAAIRNNMIAFVNQLVASDVNFSLGLCRFGQSSNSGNPFLEDNGQLTTNATYFKDVVWMRNNVSGGREPGYYAITQSASGFNFRPGSQKIFIILTDETPNQGGATQQQAIDACLNNSINLYALTNYESAALNQVATATGGRFYNITDSFLNILNDISQSIGSNYLIRYSSSVDACNGVLRNVNVVVNHNGHQANVATSYMPCQSISVQRTNATIALHNTAWAENSTLPIGVTVTDNFEPYANSVKLFYKRTSAFTYQSVNMVNTSPSVWTANIPTSSVLSPGVDYYITASDGQNTVSSPSTNPVGSPYQIAVLPNVAPVIMHTPIQYINPGASVNVQAEIIDNTNSIASTEVFYRRFGDRIYTTSQMVHLYSNTYQFSIPGNFIVNTGLQYYIKAKDDLGVASYRGNEDNPIFVGVNYWETHLRDGIAVQVIETKPQSNMVKYVGYKYRKSPGELNTIAFELDENGYAFLEQPDKAWYSWYVTFDDEILLWDKNPMTDASAIQLGHINFEYNFKWESDFTRHAIIVLHNDGDMCETGNIRYFPYSPESPDYPKDGGVWDYFQQLEYPVSMLIPPYYNNDPASGSGYRMPSQFDKKPILFVHGLTGTFSYADPANKKGDEVSYWFSTEKLINLGDSNGKNYQAWQLYYPGDMDLFHASKCLKHAIETLMRGYYPNKKINIVTHSMGGLVTSEYITNNDPQTNKTNIGKILFSVPPIHGSLGANLNYKTDIGRRVEFKSNKDPDAPCYRDMSIGSDFMWNLHGRDWNSHFDFNGSGDIYDDVFVIIGTTKENYLGRWIEFFKEVFAEESLNNNDVTVSIPSASLIDHNIGFASINGNHDDGRWTVSHLNDINILPKIIRAYFNGEPNEWESFKSDMTGDQFSFIKTFYSPQENKIMKPGGNLTFANLVTDENNVTYQKGLLSIELPISNPTSTYYVKDYSGKNILFLKKNINATTSSGRYLKFNKNTFASKNDPPSGIIRTRYYATLNYLDYVTINLPGPLPDETIIYERSDGVGLNLLNSQIKLIISESSGIPEKGLKAEFDFSNCKSHYVKFVSSKNPRDDFFANNETNARYALFNPDTKDPKSMIHIDDQTSSAEFVFYYEDAWENNQLFDAFIITPDNLIIDSTTTTATWINMQDFHVQKFIIQNPIPGTYELWSTIANKDNDSSLVAVKANLNSALIAYNTMPDTIYNADSSFKAEAFIKMLNKTLIDSVLINAEVLKPNFHSDTIILNQTVIETDSGFLYQGDFPIDSLGNYQFKIFLTGKYNGHIFERVLYHDLSVLDNAPRFVLPDFTIDTLSLYVNVKPMLYCLNVDRDSISFNVNVIESNIDPSAYYFNFDNIRNEIFVAADFSQLGFIKVKCDMIHENGLIIPDTMLVTVTYLDIIDEPTVYNVLGGGGYCIGAVPTGISVELNGSQDVLQYQLFRNNTAYGTPLNGTGLALIWNNVPSGTYTIGAITGANYFMMNGSVEVFEQSPVAIAVNITADQNNICAGTVVNFEAFPENAGTSPAFLWNVNDIFTGVYGTDFSYAPTNGDLVTLLMVTNNNCTTNGTAITSTPITMVVNPNLPVSLNISSSQSNVIEGNPVTLTASAVNGGNNPVYQWKVNGNNVGSNTNTFTFTPLNNDAVICILTSSENCVLNNQATSNTINIVVQPPSAAVVNITASANNVCAGTDVTFTATTVNAGTNPTYQWKVNGITQGGNSSAFVYQPAHNDVVTLSILVNNGGAAGTTANSNQILMLVEPLMPVGVSISASANNICEGTSVTYTAVAFNGGPSPVFQWFVNGLQQGATAPVYSYLPQNEDNVFVKLFSSENCVSNNPAQSNEIAMIVNPKLTPEVSISTEQNNVCFGTNVTFVAEGTHAGNNPAFYWYVNDINIGENNPVFTYMPMNGDQVKVIMLSDYECLNVNTVQSNILTLSVTEPVFNIVVEPEEAGVATIQGTIGLGNPLLLHATPNAGWVFSHWSDQNGNILSTYPTFGYYVTECSSILKANFEWETKLNGQLKYFNQSESVIPSPNENSVFYAQLFENGEAYGEKQQIRFSAENELESSYEFRAETGSSYTIRIWEESMNSGLQNSWTWNNWGGVSALDALIVNYMVVQNPVLENYPWIIAPVQKSDYTPLFSSVADANNSNTITSLDALMLLYRMVNYPNTSPFPGGRHNFQFAGKYAQSLNEPSYPIAPEIPFTVNGSYTANSLTMDVYYEAEIPVINQGLNVFNTYLVATGDLNASYLPNNPLKSDILLSYGGTIHCSPKDEIWIPFKIMNQTEVGAITLDLKYDNSLIEVLDLTGFDIFKIDHEIGIIKIAWMNIEGKQLAPEDELLQLKVKLLTEIDSNQEVFDLLPSTEFVDKNATIINGLTLSAPYIQTGTANIGESNGIDLSHALYPNPIKNTALLKYLLPENGKVKILIYNSVGQPIMLLHEGFEMPGSHSISISTDQFNSNGAYFYKIEFESNGSSKHGVGGFILFK